MKKSEVKTKCPKCEAVFIPSLKEVQSRAGKSSRTKGQAFERLVAKKLQDWWGGSSEFKRSPQSGGSVLRSGFDMAGDIVTNATDFPWHLELKNQPSKLAGLHQFFTCEKFVLYDYLAQAEQECHQDRLPMVVFTTTGYPILCAARPSYVKHRLEAAAMQYLALDKMSGRLTLIWSFDDMLASTTTHWARAKVYFLNEQHELPRG